MHSQQNIKKNIQVCWQVSLYRIAARIFYCVGTENAIFYSATNHMKLSRW